jgi:ABC-2 type transport system ATP-binding protein
VPAIETTDMHRTYRSRTGLLRSSVKEVEALKGISLSIEKGQLFGLLGPNGAGKTTTIKILTTLLLPTSGQARVLGHDVAKDARAVRRRIGYVFGGDRGLYERLTARDNLRYFAELYGVPPRQQASRIGQLLELVGLNGRERELVEGYSRGMRQRLHIARGMLHDPDVIFLDEPTIGIDPVGARELRQTIAGLTAAAKTVLLTTHYMFEADELCDEVAVIDGGRIVALGSPADLKGKVSGGRVLEVEVYGLPDHAVEAIQAVPGVRGVVVETRDQAQVLSVRLVPGAEITHDVLRCLDGESVGKVAAREPTLEDAYVELISGGIA